MLPVTAFLLWLLHTASAPAAAGMAAAGTLRADLRLRGMVLKRDVGLLAVFHLVSPVGDTCWLAGLRGQRHVAVQRFWSIPSRSTLWHVRVEVAFRGVPPQSEYGRVLRKCAHGR